MIAANMKPLYEKEARERSLQNLKQREELPSVPVDTLEEKGRTSEIVGNMFGVSAKTVHRASAVIKNGVEELQEAVKLKPLYAEEAKLRKLSTQNNSSGKEAKEQLHATAWDSAKGEVNKIVGDMLGISKAGKSTFQWIGGCKKYTYFVYIWDTLYLKYL